MARRLIVDTGVLVASERGRAHLAEVVAADDDLVVAAITVAELRTGVELATGRHAPPARSFCSRFSRLFRSSNTTMRRRRCMDNCLPMPTAAGRRVEHTTC